MQAWMGCVPLNAATQERAAKCKTGRYSALCTTREGDRKACRKIRLCLSGKLCTLDYAIGLTTDERERIKVLEREVKELRCAN